MRHRRSDQVVRDVVAGDEQEGGGVGVGGGGAQVVVGIEAGAALRGTQQRDGPRERRGVHERRVEVAARLALAIVGGAAAVERRFDERHPHPPVLVEGRRVERRSAEADGPHHRRRCAAGGQRPDDEDCVVEQRVWRSKELLARPLVERRRADADVRAAFERAREELREVGEHGLRGDRRGERHRVRREHLDDGLLLVGAVAEDDRARARPLQQRHPLVVRDVARREPAAVAAAAVGVDEGDRVDDVFGVDERRREARTAAGLQRRRRYGGEVAVGRSGL